MSKNLLVNGGAGVTVDLESFKKMKGFKIVSINVRSLLSKWDQFQYAFLDGALDVIYCNETWLVEQIPDSMVVNKNYSIYRLDRKCLNVKHTVKTGGGICTFVSKRCTTDKVAYEKFNVSNENLELLCLKINCGKNKSLAVMNVYRPPSGNVNSAVETLTEVFDC